MYILLFLLWLIFNGQVTLEIVIFGIFLSALVYVFAWKFMDYNVRREWFLFKNSGRILVYLLVLLWEILKANVATIAKVIAKKNKPEPALVSFEVDIRTELGKVLLANSITLTPGTITVTQEGNRFMVHCLDKSFGDGIEDSVFVRRIKAIEKDYFLYKGKINAKSKKEA